MTSAMLSSKRAISLWFNSRVRKVSVNWKVSTMSPPWLEKASAFTIFMPQAESAPAMSAKSIGRRW